MAKSKYSGPVYALKWLNDKGQGTGGRRPYQYNLPVNGEPGKWHSKTKSKRKIETCVHGFHCTTKSHIMDFYLNYGRKLYLVEIGGHIDAGWNKVAVENIRIVREIKYRVYCKYGHNKIEILDKLPIGTLKMLLSGVYGVIGVDRIGNLVKE